MKSKNLYEMGTELECPHCGGNNLHQEHADVYFRAEDAPTGVHLSGSDRGYTVGTRLDGNPSSRRDGMKITFNCEQRCPKSVLGIVQHKGTTFIGWL